MEELFALLELKSILERTENEVMGNRRPGVSHKEDNLKFDLLLDLAKSAVAEWTPERNNRDWKRGVARQAGVTVKWLTRAVNKVELSGPKQPEAV
jgi:hypothetical protein